MTTVVMVRGDGIGPEIMDATLRVLEAAKAPIDFVEATMGEQAYLSGVSSGIPQEAWESIQKHKIVLKAPITTPQGGGYKSLNVTLRKALSLYANVRPCISYHPAIDTSCPELDLVIIRENEEDTYGGIEHQQTQEVVQCLKLISRPGCERIVRYAFEYARQQGRKRLSCFSKDNIMKRTDGLFHRIFDEIGKEYPEIEQDHWIIDIGTARLATQGQRFDTIVTLNLYGDIISDVAAELTGSVGLVGTANVGDEYAMFEAIHGSAPDIAGQGIANPSGLLLGAVQLLTHIGAGPCAERVHNAWMRTLEDGIHTGDIFRAERSKERVGTQAFADAIIARLGETPTQLKPARYPEAKALVMPPLSTPPAQSKSLEGVDIFLEWSPEEGRDPNRLGAQLSELADSDFELRLISNRGAKVWPDGFAATFCTDHWRCRFMLKATGTVSQVIALQQRVHDAGLDLIKTEHLYALDGSPVYSRSQGE